MKDVLTLLGREPELEEINRGFVRHEGAYKSILTDPPLEVSPLIGQDKLDDAVFVRAQGSKMWDRHGNEFIDWEMNSGALILGHHSKISDAVNSEQVSTAASALMEIIPAAEGAILTLDAKTARATAIDIARSVTSRKQIVFCSRWTQPNGVADASSDSFVALCRTWEELKLFVTNSSSKSTPIAAIVVEPVSMESHEKGFLSRALEWAHAQNALLIVDETLSGFRLALGGAQEYFKVEADLAYFGENLAAGASLGAVTGRKKYLPSSDSQPTCSALSIAAASAFLQELRHGKIIGQLWDQGKKLKDGMDVFVRHERLEGFLQTEGFAPCFRFVFRDAKGNERPEFLKRFREECYLRHIHFGEQNWVSFSHTFGDIDKTLRTGLASLRLVASGRSGQEGKHP
jgi:glutamate-1-semialdehyde aminotransferase